MWIYRMFIKFGKVFFEMRFKLKLSFEKKNQPFKLFITITYFSMFSPSSYFVIACDTHEFRPIKF